MRRFNCIDAVHQQAETIAQVDQTGVDGRARAGVEDQTSRIGFTANAEVLHVKNRFLFHRNRRAHFQHVRAEYQVVAVFEVVGVVLHKGGAALQTG